MYYVGLMRVCVCVCVGAYTTRIRMSATHEWHDVSSADLNNFSPFYFMLFIA